jgi:hypothetical protein
MEKMVGSGTNRKKERSEFTIERPSRVGDNQAIFAEILRKPAFRQEFSPPSDEVRVGFEHRIYKTGTCFRQQRDGDALSVEVIRNFQ